MSETIQAQTNILAVGGIFSSGTDLIWAAMGFLGAVALFMGTVSAIGKVKKEGTGAAITGQIGAIVSACSSCFPRASPRWSPMSSTTTASATP